MIRLKINKIPAILFGDNSDKLFIYIHGQGGNKEEAELFSKIASRFSWQVLSIDLPEHGDRREEKNSFNPWSIVPELLQVMKYAKSKWNKIALCANSIGAWFSMLSFSNEELIKSIFVSPIVDMENVISNMMAWANVSEDMLKRELIINTSFGQTLSFEYLQYAREHTITNWRIPTDILYAENDNLTEFSIIKSFSDKFNCSLTIMKNGEHWFHTQEQLNFLNTFTETCFHNLK